MDCDEGRVVTAADALLALKHVAEVAPRLSALTLKDDVALGTALSK